jgi:hypothetical protein
MKAEDKVERYEWASTGDKGKSAVVNVNDLHIDTSYQRPEVSEKNTLATARLFNWSAFGTIVVMERSGGKKFIVDGQQRWLAAKRRGIAEIPCRIFSSNGRDHEAQAFCQLNTNRTAVRVFVRFNARATAGFQPEETIQKWLAGVGWQR